MELEKFSERMQIPPSVPRGSQSQAIWRNGQVKSNNTVCMCIERLIAHARLFLMQNIRVLIAYGICIKNLEH